jgi:transposase
MENFKIKKCDFNMGLPVINHHTAGIDIGSMLMTVSYTGKDGYSYLFECSGFTTDLKALVNTLSQEEVTDVAMEATGVYWMSLYELLEDASMKVILINPSHFKNVAAHKTDVNDSQWIHQLHACGLLRRSHIAADHFRELRHYIHERGVVQQQKSDTLNRIHRQLTLMNLKVQHQISDIEGVGGMKLLRAIANGISDPLELLSLLDLKRFKATPDELFKSLQGIYKEQFVTLLKMKLKEYDFYKEQMLAYDGLIEKVLQKIVVNLPREILQKENLKEEKESDKKQKTKYYRKNEYSFDVATYLKQIYGVDLCAVSAFDEKMLLDIAGVVGADLSKWDDPEKFVDYLGLSPRRKKTGGKVVGHEKKKVKNPATQAFRLAARSLWNSNTPLGHMYRRLSASKGGATANKAVARKLARLFYTLVKKQVEYDETMWAKQREQQEKREVAKMKKMAEKLGFEIKVKAA